MSRSASSRAAAVTSDHEQDRDDDPDGIPLGAYRENRIVISGTYLPERDVVLVEDSESRSPLTVSRATWLDWSQGQMIDRVARQRRGLVRDGEFLAQPECADAECACRLTSLEIDRSEDAGLTDDPRCRTCLSECFADGEIPPWVSPEDRTVDRSAVEAVRSD